MTAMAFVAGKAYLLVGSTSPNSSAADAPGLATQTSVVVYPTRTLYEFGAGGATISLEFFTAQLPSNLTIMAR